MRDFSKMTTIEMCDLFRRGAWLSDEEVAEILEEVKRRKAAQGFPASADSIVRPNEAPKGDSK